MIPDVFKDQCRPTQCHVRPGDGTYFFVPVDPRRDPFQFAGSFRSVAIHDRRSVSVSKGGMAVLSLRQT